LTGLISIVKKLVSQFLSSIRQVINSSRLDFFVLGESYYLKHLRRFSDYVVGPIQRDEALFLYALVKMVDPKTIVEFGFYKGASATNFLKAMSSDARLYSYDISNASMRFAGKIRDSRFRFILKSLTAFVPSDTDNRPIDLAFFDASHDFDLNVAAFEKVKGCLNERGLVVVHDTGAHYVDSNRCQTPTGYFLGGQPDAGYIHQPNERKFVNYIRKSDQNFEQIHLHCTTKFRHGLTVLQRNTSPLPL